MARLFTKKKEHSIFNGLAASMFLATVAMPNIADNSKDATRSIFSTVALVTVTPVVDEKNAGQSKWPQGWRPYASIFSGFLMMACTWGLVMTYGVFFTLYRTMLLPSATDLKLSLIGGTQSFLTLFLSFIVGRLLDVGKHHWILGFGLVLMLTGLYSLSFVGHSFFLAWLTSGFITGLGMSCFFMYSSHNPIGWVPRNPYMVTGLTASGSGVGGVIFPQMFGFIDKFGFATGVRIFVSVIAFLLVIACGLGSPKPPQKEAKLGPILKIGTWISTKAMANIPYGIYTASMWLSFAAYYPLAYHLAEWADERREPGGFPGFWFVAILNGSNFIGRVGTGYIASRSGLPIVIQSISTIMAAFLVMILWPLAANEASAISFCILLGILAGAIFGLPASCVNYLIPDEHQHSRGLWTGLMWSSSAPWSLIGPLIVGALKPRYGVKCVGFWSGTCFFGASFLLLLSFTFGKKAKHRCGQSSTGECAVVGQGD